MNARSFALIAAVALFAMRANGETPLGSFDIPFERFTLDNGLTVVVSEDHSIPEVHIEVRYRVGSRDEKPGKTGFAHLFEHLMFNGSENWDDEHFTALRPYGARINGTTNPDRTNYFNIVPSNVVERVLFLESDRMGHLLGALTQEKLDEQRGVVQNEKRQGDNSMFGYMRYKIVEALFPPGHPYSWSTIGSMDDLNAASLEDAKEWFGEYYGPSNAFIVLVGDIDVPTAKALTEKYFGDIPPGKPVARDTTWVPKRTNNTLETIQDEKAKAIRLVRLWVTPGGNTREGTAMQSVADALNDESSEWLYKSLVKGAQVADGASASSTTRDLAGWFSISMNLKAGVDPDVASLELDRVMARFMEKGPSEKSLEGGKTSFAMQVARSIEPNNGRAYWLASSETSARDPGFYKQQFQWYDETTPGSVRDLATKWLGTGSHQINILPRPKLMASDEGVDRSVIPVPSGIDPVRVPQIHDTTLDNGVRVRFIESRKAPLLTVRLQFDGGNVRMTPSERAAHAIYAAVVGTKTKSRTRDDIVSEQQELGLSLTARATDKSTNFNYLSLSALADKGMDLFADTIRNARFDADEFRQQHTNHMKGYREYISGKNVGNAYLEKILFGADHPFASYSLSDVENVVLNDVKAIHERWIRPRNLTILAVGNASPDEVRKLLNDRFGDWKISGDSLADFDIPLPENPQQVRVVLFDLPDAVQTSIRMLQLVPGMDAIDAAEYARKISIKELGGHFGSRLNSNLREDKGWSYGIGGALQSSMDPRYWIISGSVQTDKTRESIEQILAETTAYGSSDPITQTQLDDLRSGELRQLATATTGTSSAMLGYLSSLESTGFADDYILGLPDIYSLVSADDALNAFNTDFDMDRLTWIIVGDLDLIEEGVRSLDLGDIEVWNELGERIR